MADLVDSMALYGRPDADLRSCGLGQDAGAVLHPVVRCSLRNSHYEA